MITHFFGIIETEKKAQFLENHYGYFLRTLNQKRVLFGGIGRGWLGLGSTYFGSIDWKKKELHIGWSKYSIEDIRVQIKKQDARSFLLRWIFARFTRIEHKRSLLFFYDITQQFKPLIRGELTASNVETLLNTLTLGLQTLNIFSACYDLCLSWLGIFGVKTTRRKITSSKSIQTLSLEKITKFKAAAEKEAKARVSAQQGHLEGMIAALSAQDGTPGVVYDTENIGPDRKRQTLLHHALFGEPSEGMIRYLISIGNVLLGGDRLLELSPFREEKLNHEPMKTLIEKYRKSLEKDVSIQEVLTEDFFTTPLRKRVARHLVDYITEWKDRPLREWRLEARKYKRYYEWCSYVGVLFLSQEKNEDALLIKAIRKLSIYNARGWFGDSYLHNRWEALLGKGVLEKVILTSEEEDQVFREAVGQYLMAYQEYCRYSAFGKMEDREREVVEEIWGALQEAYLTKDNQQLLAMLKQTKHCDSDLINPLKRYCKKYEKRLLEQLVPMRQPAQAFPSKKERETFAPRIEAASEIPSIDTAVVSIGPASQVETGLLREEIASMNPTMKGESL